jgi:hypothetical protein
MGSLNPMGWALVATASGTVETLWDMLGEFAQRTGDEGPTVHALVPGLPRWCVHPNSQQGVEFRHDDLLEALKLAVTWKAMQMDPDDLWRRD